MKRSHLTVTVCGLLLASLIAHPAQADVLNMGGTRDPATGHWTGLASLETVPVGNVGNAADTAVMNDGTSGYGRVDYKYRISKYEVTAGQYCEFLNKVAGVDTYGLYFTAMWSDAYGCKIERFSGNGTTSNPYEYRVASDHANRPVNRVSFADACRFANWLQNGQPTGAQDTSTTEDGVYAMNGAMDNAAAVTRKPGWRWAITSENEWYKAAYYDPNKTGGAGYWLYPTRSNTAPGQDMSDVSGNNANYVTPPYAYPIDNGHYTTVAGEFQNSPSAYGTFDQGGNVMEWNESLNSGGRYMRGGAFSTPGSPLQAGNRYYYNVFPIGNYMDHGFRVVQVPVLGDVNDDGHVDMVDLLYLVDAFGSTTGAANYNPACDFNHDGSVDVVDLLYLADNFET
jgi:formylglycine-generating enzyme